MNKLRIIIIALLLALAAFAFPVMAQDTTPDDDAVETTDDGNIIIDADEAAEGFIRLTDEAAEGLTAFINNFINRLYTVPRTPLIQVLMVIGGVLLLLGGWRIYNWIVLIAGVLIGAATAVALVPPDNTVLVVAAMLIGALIGAGIAAFAYYVAVFFIGAYIGLILVGAVAATLGISTVSIWILLIAAIIGGLVMIGLSFELLVLLASLVGAQLLVIALNLYPPAIWLLGLTILGVVLQYYVTRRAGYTLRRRPARNPFRTA